MHQAWDSSVGGSNVTLMCTLLLSHPPPLIAHCIFDWLHLGAVSCHAWRLSQQIKVSVPFVLFPSSQISYGAASPSLSQENLFPRFMRTNPSEVQSNKARFSLMRMYNWRRVATLHETQTIFSLVRVFHCSDVWLALHPSKVSSALVPPINP